MKKIIAFYLPQYHAIPENDEWWGKGFTDWVNVKKAEPLYKNHKQPRVPLNKNYYDLTDVSALKWQADLAREYGLGGLCYYHYWFNGKLLLEKPMELMLQDKSVDIPFYISWANETWARTWDGREKDILIKQEFAGEEDWEKHIKYLLPFFKDERYIKVDNKPMMLLYTTSRIDRCDEMVAYWDKFLKDEGFDGLYVVETINTFQNKPVLKNSQALVHFEPQETLNQIKKDPFHMALRFIRKKYHIGPFKTVKIDDIYKHIENRKHVSDKVEFDGSAPGWDNSARKGDAGTITTGNSPLKFKNHLKKLLANEETGDFIFINAWNEWAEGAYLEPDELTGYEYLEAMRDALNS